MKLPNIFKRKKASFSCSSAVEKVLFYLIERAHHQDTGNTIIDDNLRLSIVFVGRPEIVRRYGAKPYLNYINRAVSDDNIDQFFVLAAGHRNISVAREVVNTLTEDKEFEEVDYYEGKIPGPEDAISACYSYLKLKKNGGIADMIPQPALG